MSAGEILAVRGFACTVVKPRLGGATGATMGLGISLSRDGIAFTLIHPDGTALTAILDDPRLEQLGDILTQISAEQDVVAGATIQ